jgi:predicted nucleic acid-binding protein
MKKFKIYLESSAINNLVEAHMPEEMEYMRSLWEMVKQGEFEIVLSNVTLNEINATKNLEKLNQLQDALTEITYETIHTNEEIEHIADVIAKSGLLSSERKRNDRLHIGCALISRADILLSNNHDDIVSVNTIMGVRKIAIVEGYGFIEIFSPKQFKNYKGGM